MLLNINPDIWGPHYWRTMHYLTMAYPDNPSEDDKEKVKKFFLAIGDILPCEKCRSHYQQNLQKYPLNNAVLSNKVNLIHWIKDLHNEVNIQNNKRPWTYEEVINEYSGKPSSKTFTVEIVTIILLILLMVVIIFYLKYKINNQLE
jgi:hypothetical protein